MTTPRFHSVDRYNAICRGFFTDGLAHELALLAKSVTRCLRCFQGLASHFIGSDHSDANSTFSGGEANLSLINEHEFMHLTIQYHACGKLHRWTRLSGYFLVREILQCLHVDCSLLYLPTRLRVLRFFRRLLLRFEFLRCPTVGPMTPRFHHVDRYNVDQYIAKHPAQHCVSSRSQCRRFTKIQVPRRSRKLLALPEIMLIHRTNVFSISGINPSSGVKCHCSGCWAYRSALSGSSLG